MGSPRLIEENVYICGFNSPKSYGGHSYFIQDPRGNWLIDSPRFVLELLGWFEKAGGIQHIFLTHRDDVGDADLYAKHFKSVRYIHEADKSVAPGAEHTFRGIASFSPQKDIQIIPAPGHTKGHSVLLYKDKFLFTGDHLEWEPVPPQLNAYPDYCWYDWDVQTESMERLLKYRFEWVLPGHGRRHKLPADQMRTELAKLVDRMKSGALKP